MTGLLGRRVLVLEDAFYLAMDVKRALQDAGAEVLGPFAEAEAALRCLSSGKPDCAVLDVKLDNGLSFGVARTLREEQVPFVFFTGYDASAIPAEFSDAPRLEKPVDAGRIAETVAAQIASNNTEL